MLAGCVNVYLRVILHEVLPLTVLGLVSLAEMLIAVHFTTAWHAVNAVTHVAAVHG